MPELISKHFSLGIDLAHTFSSGFVIAFSILTQIFSQNLDRRRFNICHYFNALIIFEAKHDFVQTRSLISSFSASGIPPNYYKKLGQVIRYTSKNINSIVGLSPRQPYNYLLPALLITGLCLHPRRRIFPAGFCYMSFSLLSILFSL